MMAAPYLPIAGGYSYAPLRVGLVLRNRSGAEVYFQPGDDESSIRETIDALAEATDNMGELKAGSLASMALEDYFPESGE